MSETFLSRWSRRKRESTSPRLRGEVDARSASGEGASPPAERAESAPHPLPASEEREIARAGGGEPESAELEAPAFDPASLPPIESIDAGTDVSAFLRPGVPADLAQAALRRAWVADPAIRDFVGLAENAWDFNAPGGVPGFEPLRAIDDVQRLAAQVAGVLPSAAQEATVPEVKNVAEATQAASQPAPAPQAAEPTAPSVEDAAPQKDGSPRDS